MATPDSTISEAGNPAAGAKPFALVSLDDFRAVDFQAVTATTDCAECSVLARLYSEAAHSAETAGDDQEARVFAILASVCGQHFKPNDPSGPFGPMWVVEGRRSAIPEDFKGAQAAAFQRLLPEIVHPGLRARVAEMIWLNDRKAHDAARVAIRAYCETTNALVDGRLKDQFPNLGPASMERLRLVERALQIAGIIGKRGQIPECATSSSKRPSASMTAPKRQRNPSLFRASPSGYCAWWHCHVFAGLRPL